MVDPVGQLGCPVAQILVLAAGRPRPPAVAGGPGVEIAGRDQLAVGRHDPRAGDLSVGAEFRSPARIRSAARGQRRGGERSDQLPPPGANWKNIDAGLPGRGSCDLEMGVDEPALVAAHDGIDGDEAALERDVAPRAAAARSAVIA